MNITDYRRLAQKNDDENYLLDKLFFRKISIFITILFIKIRITPNQATLLSLLAALASLYFLAFNSRLMLFAAALLILVYYLLDHVDGELARFLRNTGAVAPSLSGHYFDVLVHRYSTNLMVFFLGISIYRLYGYIWAPLVGFAACIGISSFPNVVASQVIAGKIARSKEQVLTDTTLAEILAMLETKKTQIDAVHRGSTVTKLKKLIIESLFFPGHIVVLILVLLWDAVLPGFTFLSFAFNLRLVFLLFFTVLYSTKTVLQSILWVQRLKHIA